MSTYLKQYHAKRADIAVASARIVTWLQDEKHCEHHTPIAACMYYHGASNLHIYASVAKSLFGSGIIDDPKLSRKANGDWFENGCQIGAEDCLFHIDDVEL